jgi:hypothetical protein
VLSRTRSSLGERFDERRKCARVPRRLVGTTAAVVMTVGLAAGAGAAPLPDPAPPYLSRDHHHHRRHTARHRAHKTDLAGYEFELILEGAHPLTPDEELGDHAALEAAEHPGAPVTTLDEGTQVGPET